ncbi:MAG: AraC family transcriptional regulator [Woeseiaceae bacterium]|jgi:AraC-like DNA-binding protein
MLYEPTTLASVARRIGETLSVDYGLDPRPIFAELGIDDGQFFKPGARVPFAKMNELWRQATAATGDPWFGFAVGARAMPGDFFVLGHAWLASATLHGAMNRLCRYGHVLTTRSSHLELQSRAEGYALVESLPQGAVRPQKAAKDAGFVALISLCDIITEAPVRPLRAELTVPIEAQSDRYDALFECPVEYGSDKETLLFAAEDLDAPLAGSIPEVARATDRIAENYIQSLDSSSVATAVRQMLVQMLPSGRTDQDTVANRLYRSRSTLQRQLSAEGTSYRDILETTRQALAEQYLLDDEYSQAQIAFMVGFADQSNFARAFKRWTGMSPGEYQKAA